MPFFTAGQSLGIPKREDNHEREHEQVEVLGTGSSAALQLCFSVSLFTL